MAGALRALKPAGGIEGARMEGCCLCRGLREGTAAGQSSDHWIFPLVLWSWGSSLELGLCKTDFRGQWPYLGLGGDKKKTASWMCFGNPGP